MGRRGRRRWQGGLHDPHDGGGTQQQQGYAQEQEGYDQQQEGYDQQQGSHTQQQGGYAQQQDSQQGSYAQQQGSYGQQQGGYAEQQEGYNQQQDGYAQQNWTIPGEAAEVYCAIMDRFLCELRSPRQGETRAGGRTGVHGNGGGEPVQELTPVPCPQVATKDDDKSDTKDVPVRAWKPDSYTEGIRHRWRDKPRNSGPVKRRRESLSTGGSSVRFSVGSNAPLLPSGGERVGRITQSLFAPLPVS